MRTPEDLERRRLSRLDVLSGDQGAARRARISAGRYRVGTFEIVHARADRWEVWNKDFAVHAFQTLREASDFCQSEGCSPAALAVVERIAR